MTFRNIASGFSCLFEAIVIAGYFAVAWLLHSWIMVSTPVEIWTGIAGRKLNTLSAPSRR